jgi:hypothetical protein
MLLFPCQEVPNMSKPIAETLDAEDTVLLLVKERDRRRIYVSLAMIVAFAGLAVAMVLMYTNP